MLISAASSEPSFWGEVVPAYLGAIGGIASAIVALIAFVLSLRTKRSVSSVKEALQPDEAPVAQETQGVASVSDAATAAPERPEDEDIGEVIAHGTLAGASPPYSAPWSVLREAKAPDARYDLAVANSSDRVLTLIGLRVFNGVQWAANYLPRESRVGPGEVRYFNLKRTGGSESNISVVELTWIDVEGSILSQRFLV